MAFIAFLPVIKVTLNVADKDKIQIITIKTGDADTITTALPMRRSFLQS